MKIMMLVNDTTFAYNLRREVLQRLVFSGYDVVVACKYLSHVEELKALGIRLININIGRRSKNPLSDMKLFLNIVKLLHTEKPDIVLTNNIKSNIYGGMACRLLGIRYMPNITGLGTAVEIPGKLQMLTTRLYKWGVAGAECVFFQNSENEQFFIDHHMMPKKARARLLPGSGVSLKVHKAMEYPADDGVVNFLFIARVMAEKGIDLYLGAAKRIYEKHKNVMFHICGQCDDEKYIGLLKEAEKSGYITYHGEQKDMIPFFEMAHCIVHPSYYPEGMSNVLLEAAAHCRPIIATDRAGCRETVNDGESGFIIPIKDEDALVKALQSFLKLDWNERNAMGIAGRKKIEKEFDRQIVVKAYIEEIEKIFTNARNSWS